MAEVIPAHSSGLHVHLQTLKCPKETLRMGVLGLNMTEEDMLEHGVPVEEDDLSPAILPDRLPLPEDAVHVTKGGVEEDGGDGGMGRQEGWGGGGYEGGVGKGHSAVEGGEIGHWGSKLDSEPVVD